MSFFNQIKQYLKQDRIWGLLPLICHVLRNDPGQLSGRGVNGHLARGGGRDVTVSALTAHQLDPKRSSIWETKSDTDHPEGGSQMTVRWSVLSSATY